MQGRLGLVLAREHRPGVILADLQKMLPSR